MNRKITLGLLAVSVVSFFLMASAFVLMGYADNWTDSPYLKASIVCGSVFWSFLLIGVCSQLALSIYIRKHTEKKNGGEGFLKRVARIGIFSFFRNKYGMASDIAFAVSAVAFVLSMALSGGTSKICVISFALAVFSFCTHCIFNGAGYRWIEEQLTGEINNK